MRFIQFFTLEFTAILYTTNTNTVFQTNAGMSTVQAIFRVCLFFSPEQWLSLSTCVRFARVFRQTNFRQSHKHVPIVQHERFEKPRTNTVL